MQEPSVLDYIKGKLNPWKEKINDLSLREIFSDDGKDDSEFEPEPIHLSDDLNANPFPWRALLSLALALAAQRFLEPNSEQIYLAIGLYLIAGVLLVWSILTGETSSSRVDPQNRSQISYQVNRNAFLVSLPFLLLSFLLFGGNRFNFLNLLIWSIGFVYTLFAFWVPASEVRSVKIPEKILQTFSRLRNGFSLKITLWSILLVSVILLSIFFRFYQLNAVPGEMFSDHAEKLLDVSDVLDGQTSIFFPRNTGREAFQMYLTAAVAKIFGTGLSYNSLKIGTALAGLFTLPFIYLLAKEIANKWVGLFALLFAGVAYWPNVIARVGLRFPLYPLFAAPTLFFLIRGLRNQSRNDFIFAGIFLGLGLHGYSSFRIMPFVVVAAVLIYIIHRQAVLNRTRTIWGLILLAYFSLIVFLPLLRYILEDPTMFSYRTLSRLGTSERMYPDAVSLIFFDNLWDAVIMPFWKNGDIWVHSVTNRPALGVVTASSFFLGIILVFARYIRSRNWLDLFLVGSIPLLMLPSILSLAFPGENPSLNRTGAAYIPIFIISALGLEAILFAIYKSGKGMGRKLFGVSIGLTLVAFSLFQNYDLVFVQYKQQFMAGAWNTSEIGEVINSFAESIGREDQAFVVPYPHWVDTRLVGINAGYPLRDYALWPENFEDTLSIPGPKLFILKPEDQDSLDQLQSIYPEGTIKQYSSSLNGKDFLIFFVPPG